MKMMFLPTFVNSVISFIALTVFGLLSVFKVTGLDPKVEKFS